MTIYVTPIPRVIDLAAPAFTLGTANTAGSAATAVASDSTLLVFDTILPDAITFGQSGAVGSSTTAARRSHEHAMESATLASQWMTTRDMTIIDGVTRAINNDAAVIIFADAAVQTVQIPIPALRGAPDKVYLYFRSGGSNGNMIWRGDSSSGAAGQDPGTNTDSVGDLSAALTGVLTAVDLVAAGLFSAETTGDMGGLNFTRVGDAAGDTINGTVLLWGAEFVY